MFWPHSTPIKSQVLEVGPKHPHFPNLPDDFTAQPRLRGTILELQGLHVVDVDLPQKLMGPADGTTECWKTELFNPGFMFPLLAQEHCWRANIRNRGRVLEEDASTCHLQGDHSDCQVLSLPNNTQVLAVKVR